MPYPNEHSARLMDPNADHKRVRRSSGSGDGLVQGVKVPESIDIIWYITEKDGKEIPQAQALRFPVKDWTEKDARDWLKSNKIDYIKFEAAGEASDCVNTSGRFSKDKIMKSAASPRLWFDIKNKEQEGESDIFIYDQIGQDWWGEGVSPKTFIKEVGDLKQKTLNLHINSPGGFVHDGLAIYNFLTRIDKVINVFIDGIAASIASVIAMAGDKIYIPENAEFMIHDPWGIVIGSAIDLRKEADNMEAVKDRLINIYTARTGLDNSRISEMMSKETYISGKDAVELGFADYLEDNKKIAASMFDVLFNDVKDENLLRAEKRRELEASLREAGYSRKESVAIANRSESVKLIDGSSDQTETILFI